LEQRDDDSESSIKNRLRVYREQTAPLIDYYRKQDLLVPLDATPGPDEVFDRLRRILDV
jgi:adenylate kinase